MRRSASSPPCPAALAPKSPARDATALRRAARLLESEAYYRAGLAEDAVLPGDRRTLKRQAATYAADARVLRRLAREARAREAGTPALLGRVGKAALEA